MSCCPNCGFDLDAVVTVPQSVIEAIRSTLGAGKRSFDPAYKRAQHALKVWTEKYGPWTPEQAKYAEDVLVAAIIRGAERGHVYSRLSDVVHHEIVDAGFKKRAAQRVDITRELAELAA